MMCHHDAKKLLAFIQTCMPLCFPGLTSNLVIVPPDWPSDLLYHRKGLKIVFFLQKDHQMVCLYDIKTIYFCADV